MILSREQIKQIEKLANILTTPIYIARMLELEPKSFIYELNEVNSQVYEAFYTGYLKRQKKINSQAVKPSNTEKQLFTYKHLNTFKAKLIIQLHA